MLNHISVCLLCTWRRERRGPEEGGEEEGEEHIHGRCHKTRNINILSGLKFGKNVYTHTSTVFLHVMLRYVRIKIEISNMWQISVRVPVYPDLRTTASDYIARIRTLTTVYSSNYQVSILSCPWALQFSCAESLQLLGHYMTAAVFRDMIQGTHKFMCLDYICTIFFSWFPFLVIYKSAWHHTYDTFHMLLYNLLKHTWQVKVAAKEQNCH